MAEYGEWNRKGATLSDVTAQAERIYCDNVRAAIAMANSMTHLFGAIGLIALVFSSQAVAESMMLAGASPEAGFAGVWRIIGAKAAPWAKPRDLSKEDAPLLEYAVDFADDEVKGPTPLSCKGAKYSSGVTDQIEAFSGKLANDKDGTLTKENNLTGPQFTIYRVYCGKDVRDYYFDEHSELVMAEGDVIYTLARPDGNPQDYQAGYSGPSFDCTKAKATGDRLICRDAALSKSDKKLGDAYVALKKSESPESFATFQNAQRAWVAHVMKGCGANVPMPETFGERKIIAECLNTEYDDRASLLDGSRAARAGALVLEPRMRFRTRAKPDTQESDIYPWMSGGPQSAAFNDFISKTLSLDKWRMDDKELFQFGDDVGELKLFAQRFYSVVRFDARIVSFQVSTHDYTGGSRDARGQSAFTWDLAKGRLVTFDDVFAKGRNWKKFVTAFCKADLHKQFGERDAPDLDDARVASTVASSTWLWGADKAIVIFTVDTISGLPGGEFDVDIPFKALKPYMKPDAPVLGDSAQLR